MKYAYARVSSKDQNLDRQIDAFHAEGIDDRHIYSDKQSGRDFRRPSYNLLVGTDTTSSLLREGDVLVIYSLDRLGRNYTEVREQWEHITKDMNVDIKVLDMPLLDTSIKADNLDRKFIADLTLQILAYVAEKERINSKARQAAGIKAAKERGKHLGRPAAEYPKNWDAEYKRWKAGDISAVQCMGNLNLTKTTFYKLVKAYENQPAKKEGVE